MISRQASEQTLRQSGSGASRQRRTPNAILLLVIPGRTITLAAVTRLPCVRNPGTGHPADAFPHHWLQVVEKGFRPDRGRCPLSGGSGRWLTGHRHGGPRPARRVAAPGIGKRVVHFIVRHDGEHDASWVDLEFRDQGAGIRQVVAVMGLVLRPRGSQGERAALVLVEPHPVIGLMRDDAIQVLAVEVLGAAAEPGQKRQ